MKKHFLFSVLLASFLVFLSIHGAYAQTSISGDDLCGGSSGDPCTLVDFRNMTQSVLYTLVILGGSALVFFIMLRLVKSWFAYRAGNAGAIKEAGEKSLNAVIGFFIIFTVLAGLLIAGLGYLGTKPEFLKLLQLFTGLFVEHAYAAEQEFLTNPLGTNNIFDLILAALGLAMRFFIYPAIIVMWTWSGFQFVYAQGNPEGLKKAKSWIFWAIIITFIAFTLQGFLFALRATALKIAPQNPAIMQPTGTDGRVAPAPEGIGSQCELSPGRYGIRATDGTCVDSSRGSTDSAGLPASGGRTGAGVGGSCRIDVECAGTLRCVNSVCQ